MNSNNICDHRGLEYLETNSRVGEKLFKILKTLESECLDEESLRRETKSNQRELDLSLTILKLHGYIEEVKNMNNCILCLTRERCTNYRKIYKITEKGRKLLKEKTK